jgi:hypothetical protein
MGDCAMLAEMYVSRSEAVLCSAVIGFVDLDVLLLQSVSLRL